jgi:hypothetical protein
MVRKLEFRPIVEFFPTYDYNEGSDLFFNNTASHQKELRKALQNTQGIYAFYNSEAEIIYVGKTERQNLWTRMYRSYNVSSRYSRYYVKHPRSQYKSAKSGGARKITKDKIPISAVAAYCSAYEIPPQLIEFAERLLIRLVPNDLINLRMEGNMTLRAHVTNTSSK